MANSCGSARIKKGQKNQLAKEEGTPVTAVTFGLTMNAAAPRSSSSIEGMAPPKVAAVIVLALEVDRGKYRE